MPEVGSVYIKVRAITDQVAADIEKGFAGVNTSSITKAGESVGKEFSDSLSKGIKPNAFSKVGEALSNFGGEAGGAREKLYDLTKTGNITGVAIGTLAGAFSSVIGGVAGLAGAIGGAVPALGGLAAGLIEVKIATGVADLAFQGIMQSVQKATSTQNAYRMTLYQVMKQQQDLAFAAEDAQHAESRAALNLEKARNSLMRTQDLPANSFAKREALQSYKDAELAFREAKAKTKDALYAQKNPNAAKTPKADPYAGLSESQKAFAQYLAGLKGTMLELKEAAAKGFLPILKTNIDSLIKNALPTLKTGIGQISKGLGDMTTELTKAIIDPSNLALLASVLKATADHLSPLGTILGNVYGIILSITKAADPLVTDFLAFVGGKVAKFDTWLKTKEGTAALEKFFTDAEIILGKLYTIFENTFGAFGGLIKANVGPGSGGQTMLDWLVDVTKNWNDFMNNVDNTTTLNDYFSDTASNTKSILDSIGGLVTQFLILGKDPNIGKTFEILKGGAPEVGDMAKKLADAGPAFAQLVRDVITFVNKLLDTKSIDDFFNTIDSAVKLLNQALENPAVKKFVDTLGQVHGVVFGITAVAKGLGFGFEYVGETIDSLKENFDKAKKTVESVKTGFEDANKALGMIKGFKLSEMKETFAFAKDGTGSTVKAFSEMAKNVSGQMGRLQGTTMTAFGNMGQSTNTFVSVIGKAGLFLMANPMIAAIALIVGAMVLLYNTSDEFRQFVDTAFKQIGQIFSDTWTSIQEALAPAKAAFEELFKTLGIGGAGAKGSPLVVFFEAIVNVVKVVIGVLAAVVTYLVGQFARGITATVSIFSGFIKIIKGITDLIGAFFKALTTGKWDEFAKAADKAFKDMKAGAMQIFAGIVNFFIDGINNGIRLANDISKNIATATGGAVKLGTIPLVPRWVPKMAKGGTVMPSAGGSLVNVAEAGRPERIEPLDANGLSARDKAMIDMMSKGSAGNGATPITMNIYPSAGMDEKDLAAVVSRQLAFELRKGGI